MCCHPRYVNNKVTGNCLPFINSIETRIINVIHDKIDSKTVSTLNNSWKVWFGKKIMGENRINQIADDKRSSAKIAAINIIPGVCYRIFREVFLLFMLITLLTSLFSAFIYFITSAITNNSDDLLYVRIIWTIIIFVTYIYVLHSKIKEIFVKTQENIEIQIKSAI